MRKHKLYFAVAVNAADNKTVAACLAPGYESAEHGLRFCIARYEQVIGETAVPACCLEHHIWEYQPLGARCPAAN